MVNNQIETFLKKFGVSRFKTQSLIDQVDVTTIDAKNDEVLGLWTTSAMISNQDFSTVIKGHYTPLSLGSELAKSLGDAPTSEEELLESVHDFSREYISVLAGGLKSTFKHFSIDTGVSLPITTSGLDQFFDIFTMHSPHKKYIYKITHNNQIIYIFDIRIKSASEASLKKIIELDYEQFKF